MTATIACTLYEGRDVPKHSRDLFDPSWVDKLYRGIVRNTTQPFEFVCVTDNPESDFCEDVRVLPFANYAHNMWCIVECLRVTGDPVLFMGLDTVITGNIDELLAYKPDFAMLQDPYHPNRMCSGVMMWKDRNALYDTFVKDPAKTDYRLGGFPTDMGWLHRHGKPEELGHRFPGQIRSYKADVRQNGIGDARIVYFHGPEKPHEIDHPVTEFWI